MGGSSDNRPGTKMEVSTAPRSESVRVHIGPKELLVKCLKKEEQGQNNIEDQDLTNTRVLQVIIFRYHDVTEDKISEFFSSYKQNSKLQLS